MDFVEELHKRIASIDKMAECKQKAIIPLFDIHKRSLPVGIDRPVILGVTETEAKHLMAKKFKTKLKAPKLKR